MIIDCPVLRSIHNTGIPITTCMHGTWMCKDTVSNHAFLSLYCINTSGMFLAPAGCFEHQMAALWVHCYGLVITLVWMGGLCLTTLFSWNLLQTQRLNAETYTDCACTHAVVAHGLCFMISPHGHMDKSELICIWKQVFSHLGE